MAFATGGCSSPTSHIFRFFVKHGIPGSRLSRWLDDVADVVAAESAAMRHWLLTKLCKQSAKLVGAIPLANVDGRLSSIDSFIMTNAQVVDEVSFQSNITLD